MIIDIFYVQYHRLLVFTIQIDLYLQRIPWYFSVHIAW